MSLDKSIEHGKDHRKPYHGAARFDKRCRCHGGCGWCLGNRMHKTRQSQVDVEELSEGIPLRRVNRNRSRKSA